MVNFFNLRYAKRNISGRRGEGRGNDEKFTFDFTVENKTKIICKLNKKTRFFFFFKLTNFKNEIKWGELIRSLEDTKSKRPSIFHVGLRSVGILHIAFRSKRVPSNAFITQLPILEERKRILPWIRLPSFEFYFSLRVELEFQQVFAASLVCQTREWMKPFYVFQRKFPLHFLRFFFLFYNFSNSNCKKKIH